MLLTGRRGQCPRRLLICDAALAGWTRPRRTRSERFEPRAAWVWSADPCAPLWPSSTGVSAPRYGTRYA
eukprot:scaffold15322_cov37-Phaeocystis_antarctica.AAC.1